MLVFQALIQFRFTPSSVAVAQKNVLAPTAINRQILWRRGPSVRTTIF